MEVHIHRVTAGYGGAAPNAMVNILKAAGFKFNESDILTSMWVNSDGRINLTYTRR